jgi:oxalate decarboxylase/phosphoglucose isomerase-like protein (cupin superfamily)
LIISHQSGITTRGVPAQGRGYPVSIPHKRTQVERVNGESAHEFMQTNTIPEIINLPKILDKRGNLSFSENSRQIPFAIKRTYWIYDVPGGEFRGGHAYKENEEFIVALSGSFDVVLDDGQGKQTFSLNRSYYGLYVPKLYWREMNNFSTNSLALVVSNTEYDADDYILDYDEFCRVRREIEK